MRVSVEIHDSWHRVVCVNFGAVGGYIGSCVRNSNYDIKRFSKKPHEGLRNGVLSAGAQQ